MLAATGDGTDVPTASRTAGEPVGSMRRPARARQAPLRPGSPVSDALRW